MNDFTKEELNLLLYKLGCTECNDTTLRVTLWNPLVDKILFMIDNYCEHEYMLDSQNMPNGRICIKCEAIKNDNHF